MGILSMESHGHHDHTGGLAKLPYQTNQAAIYAHPDVFTKKYSIKKGRNGDTYNYIGIKPTREELESKFNGRFVFTNRFTPITDQIFFGLTIVFRTLKLPSMVTSPKVAAAGVIVLILPSTPTILD